MQGLLGMGSSAIGQGGADKQMALSGIQYLVNRRNAKKDARDRPVYTPPDEVAQGLNYANQLAMQGTPQQILDEGRAQDYRSTAYGLSGISSRKGGLAGIAALDQNLKDSEAARMAQSAEAQYRNQQNVFGQLSNVANYKDMAYQFNTINPYFEGISSRDAAQGALMKNVSKQTAVKTEASKEGLNSVSGLSGISPSSFR